MLRLGDDNTGRRTVPFVTYSLIALNVVVFLTELSQPYLVMFGTNRVAYGAHIGGFVSGLILALLLRPARPRQVRRYGQPW